MEKLQEINEVIYRCLSVAPKNVLVNYRQLRRLINTTGKNTCISEIKSALLTLRDAKLLNFIEETDYEICITA